MQELGHAVDHYDLLHVDLGLELFSRDLELGKSQPPPAIPVVLIALVAPHQAAA